MVEINSKNNSKQGKDTGPGFRLNLSARQWVVAFLIGVATVFAAAYGWRAAAIGSTAAFDDRQSISETIAVEQQTIDVALGVTGDLRDYNQYLADYAVAAELDNQASAIEEEGDGAAAKDVRREAQLLRQSSTERAADSGVFGRFSIADDLEQPSATPAPSTSRIASRHVRRRRRPDLTRRGSWIPTSGRRTPRTYATASMPSPCGRWSCSQRSCCSRSERCTRGGVGSSIPRSGSGSSWSWSAPSAA